MSTLTLQRKENLPNLDPPSDLTSPVKTSFVLQQEVIPVKTEPKKTTTTKSE